MTRRFCVFHFMRFSQRSIKGVTQLCINLQHFQANCSSPGRIEGITTIRIYKHAFTRYETKTRQTREVSALPVNKRFWLHENKNHRPAAHSHMFASTSWWVICSVSAGYTSCTSLSNVSQWRTLSRAWMAHKRDTTTMLRTCVSFFNKLALDSFGTCFTGHIW